MKVGVLTGGGDCPGLNAVIRAVVRKAERVFGDEVIGFLDGWAGVVDKKFMTLDVEGMRGTLPKGGTIRISMRVLEVTEKIRISNIVPVNNVQLRKSSVSGCI